MPPYFAGSKRPPLEMVLYDPATTKRARHQDYESESSSAAKSSSPSSSSAASGATTTTAPPHAGPIVVLDVAPINTLPPRPPLLRLPPPASGIARQEPPCLRRHFLAALGLRADLPVHFIDDKLVTSTDLDAHQNRFRIPSSGVERRLRPLLRPDELDAASLLHDPCPAPRPRNNKKRPMTTLLDLLQLEPPPPPSDQPPQQQEQQDDGADDDGGKKAKKPKRKGKVHGGLRVKLVSLDAGAKELQMSRWESSRGTIVKGEGYLDFIRRCRFREREPVEIWAFVQRRVRLFGADVCGDSLLHVLVVKKQQEQEPGCCYCRRVPSPPAPVPVAVAPLALIGTPSSPTGSHARPQLN